MLFYATFGSNQGCVKNDVVITGRSCVEIEAENYEAAKEKMFDVFGPRWAFLYESPVEAGVEQWGLELVEYDKLVLGAQRDG